MLIAGRLVLCAHLAAPSPVPPSAVREKLPAPRPPRKGGGYACSQSSGLSGLSWPHRADLEPEGRGG